MKKFALLIVSLLFIVLAYPQNKFLPSFQGIVFPASPGLTGSCDISVSNANAKGADSVYIYKPYKCEFFPVGSPTVVSKDSILTDYVTVYNIPIGLFHFKMSFKNGYRLDGDCQIGTKLPDGRIIYQNTTLIKYPNSK